MGGDIMSLLYVCLTNLVARLKTILARLGGKSDLRNMVKSLRIGSQ